MTNKKYMLAIKRNRGDFQPLEWNRLPFYDNENLSTLEGIDTFTTKTNLPTLLYTILDNNILDGRDYFQNFTIIFEEKERVREVKEGVAFEDSLPFFNDDLIIDLITTYSNNGQFINEILNVLAKDKEDPQVQTFIMILKNRLLFKAKGDNYLKIALSNYKNLNYETRRKIALKIKVKLPSQDKSKELKISNVA